MSVPVFRTSTQSARFSSTTNWSMSAPAGVVAGDLLLAIFDTNAAAGSFSLAGWTAGPTTINGTSIYTLARIADGSEGSTYAFASSTGRTGVGVVLRIDGTAQTVAAALGPHAETFSSAASPMSVASIDTTVADTLLLGIGDTGFNIGSFSFSSTGFTKVVDLDTTSQEQIEVFTKSFPTPGAVGSTSWATSGATSRQMMVLAIQPPAVVSTGQLWPHGKKSASPTTGQLFPRGVIL